MKWWAAALVWVVFAFANVSSFPTSTSMYEISTRPWLYYLSQKYNTNIQALADIPQEELVAIANRGFKYVWFMGLWALVILLPY
jgi:hypothetical protein